MKLSVICGISDFAPDWDDTIVRVSPLLPNAYSRTKLFFLILLTLCTPAFSQVTAAITGKILDASGNAVRGAAVTVKSLETGATRA